MMLDASSENDSQIYIGYQDLSDSIRVLKLMDDYIVK